MILQSLRHVSQFRAEVSNRAKRDKRVRQNKGSDTEAVSNKNNGKYFEMGMGKGFLKTKGQLHCFYLWKSPTYLLLSYIIVYYYFFKKFFPFDYQEQCKCYFLMSLCHSLNFPPSYF